VCQSNNGGVAAQTLVWDDPVSTATSTSPTSYYVELIRVDADNTTLKIFTDSGFSSQYGTTITRTTSSDVNTLRYLMIRIYSQTVTGSGLTGSITDLKYYDAINDVNVAANPCSLAVDDNVATFWKSSAEANPNIYVDMSSATTTSNIAVYPNSATDETEIKIQSSPNASAWTDQRTITWSNLTEGAWNYIRFNLVSARYWRIYGNSGASKTLAIDEIKVLDSVADADVRNLHGHISISSSDTSLNNAGV